MSSLVLSPYYETRSIYEVNKFNAYQILADSLGVLSKFGINITPAPLKPWRFNHERQNLDGSDLTMVADPHTVLFTGRTALFEQRNNTYGIATDGTDGICYRSVDSAGRVTTKSIVQVRDLASGHGRAAEEIKATTIHEIGHGVLDLRHCQSPTCYMQEIPDIQSLRAGRTPHTFCGDHKTALAKIASI